MASKGGTLSDGVNSFYPNAYYDIGDLFFTTRNENPSIRFGGTWELFGKGKTLVCVDTEDSDFNSVKKTGGTKTHNHTLGSAAAMIGSPSGNTLGIGFTASQNGNLGGSSYSVGNANSAYANGHPNRSHNTALTGTTDDSTNIQPYITCYIWIRTE